jgi:hypothetical protein
VSPKEILVMDLAINQTISSLVLERGGSPFKQALSTARSDLLYVVSSRRVLTSCPRIFYTLSDLVPFQVCFGGSLTLLFSASAGHSTRQ